MILLLQILPQPMSKRRIEGQRRRWLDGIIHSMSESEQTPDDEGQGSPGIDKSDTTQRLSKSLKYAMLWNWSYENTTQDRENVRNSKIRFKVKWYEVLFVCFKITLDLRYFQPVVNQSIVFNST